MSINLVCCTQTICAGIARGRPQKDIAFLYALAIKSATQKADTPDWHAINTAILSRWAMSGLKRIKKRAFDLAAGKVKLIAAEARTKELHDLCNLLREIGLFAEHAKTCSARESPTECDCGLLDKIHEIANA